MIFKLILLLGGFPLLEVFAQAHDGPVHATLAEYAGTKAALLDPPLFFTSLQTNLLQQGAVDEDSPVTRCLAHAWNPLTGATFGGGGSDNALVAGSNRWGNMTAAFSAADFYGGDDSGAWHFLGRASHLVQDMTAPMHVFGLWHAGIRVLTVDVDPVCHFEDYWSNNIPALRVILDATTGGPLHSSMLPPEAGQKLDDFSRNRLGYHFTNSCPDKDSDDVRGYAEVLAWTTYFRCTFWGEIKMGSCNSWGCTNIEPSTLLTTPTDFDDGHVGAITNTLHVMFNGNVKSIYQLNGDNYYQITDSRSNVFYFMKDDDVDDWAGCAPGIIHEGWASGKQDSSTRVGTGDDDTRNVRVTGRFWFDTRELGRDTNGLYNRYCYPNRHPDGTPMTNHLHQYFGEELFPLTMRYNAGLLGLANRRVTVKTADATPANDFSWSRMDNFGNGPSFSAGSGGSNFYFAAKSSVALTAPAADTDGRSFVRWLRDGLSFSGNTTPTITINGSDLPIPTNGVAYTAQYSAGNERPPLAIARPDETHILISWPAGSAVLQESTDLEHWTNCASQANPQTLTTSARYLFFRLLVP